MESLIADFVKFSSALIKYLVWKEDWAICYNCTQF